MSRVGDVTLTGECLNRFLSLTEEGATTVYSVTGVTYRLPAIASVAPTAEEGTVTVEPEPTSAYDPNAHMIKIDGVHVGYLKRGRAPPTRVHGVVRASVDPYPCVWIAVS